MATTGLELRLSELIGKDSEGKDRNKAISFELATPGSQSDATLCVRLDDRLVEIPLRQQGVSTYVRINPEEKMIVIPELRIVRVTTQWHTH